MTESKSEKQTFRPRILTAKWDATQDTVHDSPRSVTWNGGLGRGSCADYRQHMDDTRTWSTNGRVVRIKPDVIAVLKYDWTERSWLMSGLWVKTAHLDVRDPLASDAYLIEELSRRKTIYRAVICR